MKCTACNTKIKPVVAVDIDGTLANYHGDFLQFAERYLDQQFRSDYMGDEEMHVFMGLPLEEYREVKLAYRQGGGKRMMPIFEGAVELMARLRNMDVEVWITTTRPFQRLDSTDPDTRFWLKRHNLPYDHLLYHEDKYRVMSESVDPGRVVAVVDDLPEQLVWADTYFGSRVPFQVTTKYNMGLQNHSWMRGDLFEATDEVAARIRAWRARND